jgi:hypothetical protein
MTYHFKLWLVSLKHYVLMCFFRSGPDNLPAGIHSILFSLFAYCLIGFSLVDEQHSYAAIIQQIAIELGLLSGFIYVGLKWKNLLFRLPQAFSALLGINMIISIVGILVYHALIDAYGSASEGDLDRNVLNAELLIVFWNLSVMSMVLKQVLDINTLLAAMISFNYFMVYQFLIVWLVL